MFFYITTTPLSTPYLTINKNFLIYQSTVPFALLSLCSPLQRCYPRSLLASEPRKRLSQLGSQLGPANSRHPQALEANGKHQEEMKGGGGWDIFTLLLPARLLVWHWLHHIMLIPGTSASLDSLDGLSGPDHTSHSIAMK